MYINLLCIYYVHELIKFIKKSHIFFSLYSICVQNYKVKLIIVYL
jgi:hypothetical protein